MVDRSPAPPAPPQLTAACARPSWSEALRGWVFGFDYFISYAQEAATLVYGAALQRRLAARDYVCFRDVTHLRPGDPLTLRIRWGLARTRCLIVLGTRKSVDSTWVTKEIDLFAGRRRTIVPIDLEGIRTQHSWAQLGDVLFVQDPIDGQAPEPSEAAVDALIGAFVGWRANRIARVMLVVVSMLAVAGAGALFWQAHELGERARGIQAQALAALARSLPDPLTAGLLLQEVDAARLPAEAQETARTVAAAAVPSAVLRANNVEAVRMFFTADGTHLVSADHDGVVRAWATSGRGAPRMWTTLPWWPHRLEPVGDQQALFAVRDREAIVVNANGAHHALHGPPYDARATVADNGGTDGGPERWSVAASASGWRMAQSGELAAFMHEHGGVTFFLLPLGDHPRTLAMDLTDRDVLDLWLDPEQDPAFAAKGRLLCTNGALMRFALDHAGRVVTEGIAMLTADPKNGVTLGRDEDAVAFFAGGRRVVVGLRGKNGIVVADGQTGERIRVHETQVKIDRWAVSAGGEVIALALEDGRSSIVELDDMHVDAPPDTVSTVMRDLLPPSSRAAGEVVRLPLPVLSRRGEHRVYVSAGAAVLWSPGMAPATAMLRPGFIFNSFNAPVFSPDGRWVATADGGGEIRIWPADRGDRDPRRLRFEGRLTGLGVSPDGSLIVGVDRGAVHLVRGDGSPPVRLAEGTSGSVHCAVEPSGARVAAVFRDGDVWWWALPGGTPLGHIRHEVMKNARYPEVAFIAERWLVVAGIGPAVLIDMARGEVVRELPGRAKAVRTATRSDRWVLLEEDRQSLAVWDPVVEVPWELRPDPPADIWDMAISANGRRIVAALGDSRFVGWEGDDPRTRWEMRIDGEPTIVMTIALSADGERFAIGTERGSVGIGNFVSEPRVEWLYAPGRDARTGAPAYRFAHFGAVHRLRFDQTGERLSSCAGMDEFCHVWSRDGQHLGAQQTDGVVTNVEFLADSRVILTTEQGEISVWHVGLDPLLRHFRKRTTATLVPSERVRYLKETQAEAWSRFTEQERQFDREVHAGVYHDFDYTPPAH